MHCKCNEEDEIFGSTIYNFFKIARGQHLSIDEVLEFRMLLNNHDKLSKYISQIKDCWNI